MGLDMYFKVEKSNFNYQSRYDTNGKELNYPKSLKNLEEYIIQRNFKMKQVTESYDIGYFRKFNALHSYIVKHFADGKDECQEIYLNKDDVENILYALKQVSMNHDDAQLYLPTQEGFFFGSIIYDDWYFSDVNEAIEFFELVLNSIDFNEWRLVYQASW